MSETLDMSQGKGGRPTFLTVLCILTFIGSGLGVLGGLLGMVGTSALGMFAPQGTMLVQIIGLAASGLCLYGAIQMWGLKKQGFTMYLIGAIIGIVGPIISVLTIDSYVREIAGVAAMGDDASSALFAESMVAAARTAAITGVVIGIIINGGFILMYNMNKKHLVN